MNSERKVEIRESTRRAQDKNPKAVTIAVLLYGDHADLANRVLQSIEQHCTREAYKLIVGCNAIGNRTKELINEGLDAGLIDQALLSEQNLNKCPMMREMFSLVSTEYLWWFDDDCFISDDWALRHRLDIADRSPANVVMWGRLAWCDSKRAFTELSNPIQFVRDASWYRGLPPPSWKWGGKGEFDFEGKGSGNGQWDFITGGEWFIRFKAIELLDWPDPRLIKYGDDVFLGEAIRQQGWKLQHMKTPGTVILDHQPSRGQLGYANYPQR